MTRAKAKGLVADPLWYKDAVIYEARVRSYYDSNGDGIGDLAGITTKLDYLADLGITALWILPHYPSPGRDDGYDIADYTEVHPALGTLEDFDELVRQAHRRGIRVITELVMNHTSDQHPWFQRARRAPAGSVERDFYVWSESPDRYQEARIIFQDFEPSNWTWDSVAKSYFWHRFFAHQPDLNFTNPAVHEAMFGVVDFWLARGVDGLRLDAVPYLYEDDGTNCENLPETHAFLKKLRAHVDAKWKDRMLLAEANQWPEDAAAYFGDGDECHMNFHFPIMPRLFMSIHMEDRFPIIDILRQTPELHSTCQWAMFLRNHDELTLEMVTDEERDYMYRAYAHEAQMRVNLGIRRRLAPLVGNDRKKMELLNGLLLSMPGTPVLYYGDEIGMGDNVFLGDRNGVRTPMQWSADRNAGFSRANPQRLILPIIIDPEYHYEAINVEAQQSNPNSLLWWTKRIVALRKRFRAFSRGTIDFLHPSNPRVLAFVRRHEDETILVVANLSRHVQFVELDLSAFKGSVPVELMGRTKFPAIGELPYLLTLGGHDFYWFSVEQRREKGAEDRVSLLGPAAIVATSLEDVFGSERSMLEEVLPSYLESRGWLAGAPQSATIFETLRYDESLHFVFVRVEYVEHEHETFVLPILPVPVASETGGAAPAPAPVNVIATVTSIDGAMPATHLIEAPPERTARAFIEAATLGASVRARGGAIVSGRAPNATIDPIGEREARILSSDRVGSSVAFGSAYVVKVWNRVDEGIAPELEVGRFLRASGRSGIAPSLAGQIEYRVSGAEPVTLGVVEQYLENEGTAWEQARTELGRAYDRVLAQLLSATAPPIPTMPLIELASTDLPADLYDLIGGYRDWATLLGKRTAELHLALSSSDDAAFQPSPYSTLKQRSKYQNARNLVGRVLSALRRAQGELTESARPLAEKLLAHEGDVLIPFEVLLTHRVDAMIIRHHGDLHLGRMLFTGKDYVITGIGGGRDHRHVDRRRKRSALQDVAGMMRSFHYAAAVSLRALRVEDQPRAEPWGWLWQRWASAAFLRGWLDAADGAPFVPRSHELISSVLRIALLEKAFTELRSELRRRPEMAWIPLQGILRTLKIDGDVG